MRDRRLVCSDFFSDDQDGFSTEGDAGTYDLVIGNAPFGKDVITQAARDWTTGNGRTWSIPNKDIGGLFLAKGAELVTTSGRVCLIQSANTLLFNIGKAAAFRTQLFSAHRVEAIYNLSALRFQVFSGKKHTTKKSVAPVCVVILRRGKGDVKDSIEYITPKYFHPLVDESTIMIEPGDRRSLTAEEAMKDPTLWSLLMRGGRRDVELIRRLRRFPTLKTLLREADVKARVGVVFGDRRKEAPHYEGMQIFDENLFPGEDILVLDTDALPIAEHMRVHSRDSDRPRGI